MSSATTTRVYQSSSADLVVKPYSATPLTTAEKAAQSAFVQSTLDADKMSALIAERKRINDMINEQKSTDKAAKDAAKANEPSKLDKEIARQANSHKWFDTIVAAFVLKRVELGQDQETAFSEVMSTLSERVRKGIAILESEAEAKLALPATPVAPIAAIAPTVPTAAEAAPKTTKSASKASK